MLFTWDTTNLCIVFRQWHVRSTASLVFSLLAVVLLGIGYEALRSVSRRYEASLATRLETVPSEFDIHLSPFVLPLYFDLASSLFCLEKDKQVVCPT